MPNGFTYHDPNGRYDYSEPPDEVAEESKSNTGKIILISVIYFFLYFAFLAAAGTTTSTSVKDLLTLILTLMNVGIWLYAAAIAYFTMKTLHTWYKVAVRKM